MFSQTESSFLGRGSLGRLDRFQRKCPQSEKELILGAQRHPRSHALDGRGFPATAGVVGEAEYHRHGTGLGCATRTTKSVSLPWARQMREAAMDQEGAAGGAKRVLVFLSRGEKTCFTLSSWSGKGCFKKEEEEDTSLSAVASTDICTWLPGARQADGHWLVVQGTPQLCSPAPTSTVVPH